MRTAKVVDFTKKHWTKEEIEKKQKAKASVMPSVKLKPPAAVRDNVVYYAKWKDIVKLYKGTELLNALDTGLLARYCIESVKLQRLYDLRDDLYNGDSDDFSIDTLLKVETRIDSKTKMLNSMALSLYMTPRARAGAIPNQPDKMAKDDDSNGDMFN